MEEARYFGICSLEPGNEITVSRWSQARTYIVLLEFSANEIKWIGRETPRGKKYPKLTEETRIRKFKIQSTTVDAREEWTEFLLEELE